MSGFIEWLEEENKRNTKVRAVLRRSLTFDLGTHVPAYPYVEWRVKNENDTRREIFYLVAGLWASHWREGRFGQQLSIGKACLELYRERDNSPSIERRFISLLDADCDQLPHRLRQMISLLKEQTIDFDDLLKGLLKWNQDKKPTQNAWARDFYLNMNHKVDTESTNLEESK